MMSRKRALPLGMMNFLIFCLVMLSAFIGRKSCHDVFICTEGQDVPQCGINNLTCCRTLKYTLENIIEDNDTILLDGGQEDQQSYYIEYAVVLSFSVKIKKSPFSRFDPVFVRNRTSPYSENYVFLVDTSFDDTFITLSLESFEIRDINLIYSRNSLCHLIIDNCVHHMPKNTLPYITLQKTNYNGADITRNTSKKHMLKRTFKQRNKNSIKESTIVVNNSHFISDPSDSKSTILTNTSVTISVNGTSFQGGQMHINTQDESPSNLIINNTRFYDSRNLVIGMYGNFDFVEILNTEFYNITQLHGDYFEDKKFVIDIQSTISSTISKGKHPYVKIINTSFIKCNVVIPSSVLIIEYVGVIINLQNINFIVRNLNIHSSNGSVANIHLHNSNGTIQNVSMTKNTISVLVVVSSSNATFYNCSFVRNSLLDDEPARIVEIKNSNVTFNSVTITGNKCHDLFMIIYSTIFWIVQSNHTSIFSDLKVTENNCSSFIFVVNQHHMVKIMLDRTLVNKNNFLGSMYSIDNIYLMLFMITNSNFTNNAISTNLLNAQMTKLIMYNVNILQNRYSTGFHLTQAAVKFKNVNIIHNEASASPKEISMSSPKSDEIVEAAFLYDVTIISKEIRRSTKEMILVKLEVQNSILKVRNLTMKMQKEQLSAIEISFDTKNADLVKELTAVIRCPIGTNPINSTATHGDIMLYRIKCRHCENWLYSTEGGEMHLYHALTREVYEAFDFYTVIYAINQTSLPTKCKECPIGGICNNGVTKSRGNFYGFKKNDNQIQYHPCPIGYCCSRKETCSSFNTCQPHRTGTLCGKCQDGFQENMFSNSCIAIDDCKPRIEYWILFASCVISLAMFITFLDKLTLGITFVCTKIKECIIVSKNRNDKPIQDLITSTDLNSKSSSVRTASSVNTNVTFRMVNESPYSCVTVTPLRSSITADDFNVSANKSPSNGSQRHSLASTELTKPYTFSGVFTILLSFYQIKSLLTVPIYTENFTLMSVISDFFNLNIISKISYTFCPFFGVEIIGKYFVKDFLFNISIPFLLMVLIAVLQVIKLTCSRYGYLQNMINRLGFGYLKCLLFIYKNVASFCLIMITCVPLRDKQVLFVQGDIECYQQWQYGVFCIIFSWILPFPLALFIAYRLYREKRISCFKMMTCLTFPLFTPFVYWTRSVDEWSKPQVNKVQFESIRKHFEESYRSTEGGTDHVVFWEHWRLFQRLILAAVTTLVPSPLERICYAMPCVLTFIIVYFKVRPYKSEFYLLHWCELASMLSFCYLLVANLFNAFLFVYSIPTQEPLPKLKVFFMSVEWICSPITALIFYIVIFPIYKRINTDISELKIE